MYNLDNAAECAAQRGQQVVEAGPRDIFVDLDTPQDQYVMDALLALLASNGFVVMTDKITRSLHGNKHAYLRAPRDLTTIERLLLQACLGSDRKRELLGFLRMEKMPNAVNTCFFEDQPRT